MISRVTSQAGGTGQLSAGTENSSQGNELDQDIFELSDNFTIPWKSHRFTVGTKNSWYKVRNLFSQNSFGNFTFGTLDSLTEQHAQHRHARRKARQHRRRGPLSCPHTLLLRRGRVAGEG